MSMPRCLFLLGVYFVVATSSWAQISVDQAVVVFKRGDQPFRNIVVSNSGAVPLTVVAEPSLIANAGLPNEQRIGTDQLFVTPTRFAVPPRSKLTVRLELRKPASDKEEVFRVKLLPEAEQIDESKSGPNLTTIKVLFSVGLLILSQPESSQSKLIWDREGDTLTLKNEGNVSILIDDAKSCSLNSRGAINESACTRLEAARLYPGHSIAMTVEPSRVIAIRKLVGEEKENLIIPPKQ